MKKWDLNRKIIAKLFVLALVTTYLSTLVSYKKSVFIDVGENKECTGVLCVRSGMHVERRSGLPFVVSANIDDVRNMTDDYRSVISADLVPWYSIDFESVEKTAQLDRISYPLGRVLNFMIWFLVTVVGLLLYRHRRKPGKNENTRN